MEQMRMKHNETGRSMVEMLGVLAVVGVLSIGGVAGYRYAVDKMNANEIINELKKRAITASQQRVLGQGINLSEYGNNGAIKGYTVTPTTKHNGNASQFALEVVGVPERVCDMIIDSDWALPTAMAVNGGSCVEGANGNIMTFAFNNTLESGDVGNGGNGEGNEGNDDPTDTPIQQCAENEYRLADGTCEEDPYDCGENQFWIKKYHYNDNNFYCFSCPEVNKPIEYDSDLEDSNCTNCKDARLTFMNDHFYCINCSADREICGKTCCDIGQQCQVDISIWPYTYTCVDNLDSDKNECLTNEDCNKNGETGQYCDNAKGCTQIGGTCKTATLYNNGMSIDIQGKTVYRSQDRMSWYAAKNFCAAKGMGLFNPSSIYGADRPTGSYDLIVSNSNYSGWTPIASGSCSVLYMDPSPLLYIGSRSMYENGYALCEE